MENTLQNDKLNTIQMITSRNHGIDLLRLYAMFLVVILHVLGQGGVLNMSQDGAYAISWLLEIFAYCAVNCFALVSGYVSYSEKEKTYRYSRYISVWLQVVCYSFGLTFCAVLLGSDTLGLNDLIQSLFPVASSHYWYFNAYTGVFFLIPWLNKFVRSCSDREMNRFILIIFMVFSGYGVFGRLFSDSFKLGGGYSFVWIALLYLAGAWMKKCRIPEKIRRGEAVLTIMICVVLTWMVKLFLPGFSGLLVSYVSPTIVLIAVSYVVIFSKLQIGLTGQKLIRIFSPAAFGVYLIHVQNVVWNVFMKERFGWIADSPVWLIPFQVIGSAAAIFITCLFVEKIRILLFQKLRINETAEKLVERLWNLLISSIPSPKNR